jgi:hypothetical protein
MRVDLIAATAAALRRVPHLLSGRGDHPLGSEDLFPELAVLLL